MSRTDIPYSAKEVVDKINIGDSTLRKWCLALEKQNYNFIRTDQNKRLFTEKDVFVLSQMKVLVQDKNMSINNAAAVIASKYLKEVFSNETEIEQVSQSPQTLFSNETLEELKTEIEQLKSMNTMILQHLEEQKRDKEELQKYIRERLDHHDKLLMQSIRETQEEKQARLQLATAQEEEKVKNLWSRLFGK
jgi:DNA-binding transcriptional MerR regulator